MQIDLLGIPIDLKSSLVDSNGIKKVKFLPTPDVHQLFLNANNIIDSDSLQILWSKRYFGIKHRTQMFDVLYNTLAEQMTKLSYKPGWFSSLLIQIRNFSFRKKPQNITANDYLTIQALFCDMIIKLGTILEDFAGMSLACWEHSIHSTKIAEKFLAYRDPIGFYKKIDAKGGPRYIQQLFRLPKARNDLDSIFLNLTDADRELIMKGVYSTANIITKQIRGIGQAISRQVGANFTYYDMYNKLKHGFAPIYPFILPIEVEAEIDAPYASDLNIIKTTILESVYIMHDKLDGQRTPQEKMKYETQTLATPTTTTVRITKDLIDGLLHIVKSIEDLYLRLVDTYLRYSEGNHKLVLLGSTEYLTKEEMLRLDSILNDPARFKS